VQGKTRLHGQTPPSSSSTWTKPPKVRLPSTQPKREGWSLSAPSTETGGGGEEEGEGEMGPEDKMKSKEAAGWRETQSCCPGLLPPLPHRAPSSSSGFRGRAVSSASEEDPKHWGLRAPLGSALSAGSDPVQGRPSAESSRPARRAPCSELRPGDAGPSRRGQSTRQASEPLEPHGHPTATASPGLPPLPGLRHSRARPRSRS